VTDQNPPQQPGWQPYPSQSQQPGGQNEWTSAPPGYELQQPGGPQYPQGPYSGGGQWQQPPQPPKKKRSKLAIGCGTIAGLIVLIIIIAVIASVANSGNGVKKDNSAGSPAPSAGGQSARTSQAPAQSSTNGPVGTTFTVTETNNSGATVKYSVTLDRVIQHARPDNGFDTAPAGDHLAAAEFTIKGISGTDQDDANNDAAAIGNDQQTYQPGFEGLAAGTNFSNGQFNTSPGSNSIGWVAFEVKNGVKATSVQWSPSSGLSGNAPATWTMSG
jgi:hypothetical protein